MDNSVFNEFEAAPNNVNKYSLSAEGKKQMYWNNDAHSSENISNIESKLLEMVVKTIPSLNKDSEFT